ncbi:hypothetical protein SUGI_0365260 [Cryptomeria japonica]|nr:hypothetical protein SUGI_0365260 [Cryptomeria japonica]
MMSGKGSGCSARVPSDLCEEGDVAKDGGEAEDDDDKWWRLVAMDGDGGVCIAQFLPMVAGDVGGGVISVSGDAILLLWLWDGGFVPDKYASPFVAFGYVECGVGARVWVFLVSVVFSPRVLVASDVEVGAIAADLVALDEGVFFVELLLWLEASVVDVDATMMDLFFVGAVVVSFGSWPMDLLLWFFLAFLIEVALSSFEVKMDIATINLCPIEVEFGLMVGDYWYPIFGLCGNTD